MLKNQYLFRSLLLTTLALTSVLCAIVWLTQSLRFVDMIINRGFSLWVFIQLVSYAIPQFLLYVLPIATAGAIAFVITRLRHDNELVIFAASGVSPLGLARPGIMLAVLASSSGLLISAYALPSGYTAFRDLQTEIRNRYATALLQEGTFTTIEPGLTLYVGENLQGDTLSDIIVHDERRGQTPMTVFASSGQVRLTENGVRLLLFDGHRQQFDAETARLSLLYFAEYALNMEILGGEPASERKREWKEYFIPELLRAEGSLPHQAPEMRAIGHGRILQPLNTASFSLIMLAMLLNQPFRRGHGSNMVISAFVMVLVLQAGSVAMQSLCIQQPDLVPLFYAVTILPVLVSLSCLIWPPRLPRLVAAKVLPCY